MATTIKAIRLTSQVTPKNKVGFYYDYQNQCNGSTLTTEKQDGTCRTRGSDWIASGTTNNIAPEAASGAQGTQGGAFGYANTYQSVIQATYTSTLTSKLLFEAGISSYMSKWGWMEPPGAITGINQVLEQNALNGMPANLTYRALDWNFNNMQNPTPWKAALSYVTGAHSMKFGYQGIYNRTDGINHYNTDARKLPLCRRDAEPADDELRRLHEQGSQRVGVLVRAGPVDDGADDAAGRRALRPCLELVAG